MWTFTNRRLLGALRSVGHFFDQPDVRGDEPPFLLGVRVVIDAGTNGDRSRIAHHTGWLCRRRRDQGHVDRCRFTRSQRQFGYRGSNLLFLAAAHTPLPVKPKGHGSVVDPDWRNLYPPDVDRIVE